MKAVDSGPVRLRQGISEAFIGGMRVEPAFFVSEGARLWLQLVLFGV